MLKSLIAAGALALTSAFAATAAAGDSLIKKQSDFSFEKTLAKLEAALAGRNINVMNKIDHAAGAANVDIPLRPTTLVLFGNPAIGSQLMAESQSIGIDLPLKALIFEDENGAIWVEVNDIRHLAKRHGIAPNHPVVGRIAGGLEIVTNAATQKAE